MIRSVIFLVLLVLAFPAFAQEAKPAFFTYRDLIWGLPKEEVKNFEKEKLYKEDEVSLTYLLPRDKEKIPTKPMLTYGFINNQLSSVRHEYFELHNPGSQGIIDLFFREEDALVKSYGEPTKRDLQWKDRTYEKFPQFWGRSLYSRDLRIVTSWDLPDTVIELQTFHDKLYYQIILTMADKKHIKSEPMSVPKIALPESENVENLPK